MLNRFEFWTLSGAGIVALVLSGVNMYLSQTNAALQARANNRAQFIQQSIARKNLYDEIIKVLANRAVNTRDEQIRDLLAGEGISVSLEDAPASPSESRGRKKQ